MIEQKPLTPMWDTTNEAPVIFIDGAQGLVAGGGIARFNLFQDRMISTPNNISNRIVRSVCANMVMTESTLIALQEWLNKAVAEMKARQGHAAQG